MYFCSQFRESSLKTTKFASFHMTKITYTECPLCKSSKLQSLFSCKDQFATNEKFDIYKCQDCSFTFTQNIPDEKEIGRYYESPSYISHSDTNKGFVNHCYHIVREIMLRKKAKLINSLVDKSKTRLLDYGAGTGYFARIMQKYDWDVTAIEKSPQARNFSKERFNFEMQAPETLNDYEEGYFDVVTMWHVMEHIQHINEFWELLYNILDDNGIAVIALPNCMSHDAQHYGENWAAYDVPRHLWHFSPSTIMKFGRKHGFILERQYTMPFDGFYISMLSEQNKGSKFSTLKGCLNGLLGWIASWNKKSASSSIIYVFRKAI